MLFVCVQRGSFAVPVWTCRVQHNRSIESPLLQIFFLLVDLCRRILTSQLHSYSQWLCPCDFILICFLCFWRGPAGIFFNLCLVCYSDECLNMFKQVFLSIQALIVTAPMSSVLMWRLLFFVVTRVMVDIRQEDVKPNLLSAEVQIMEGLVWLLGFENI